jgi:hypothetical protein
MTRPPGRIENFLRHVDKTRTCWLWTGHCDPCGYGVFQDGDRKIGAHRWSHMAFSGPIPDDMEIDHLCRERSCVNPDHLEVVTHAENIRRAAPATKGRCVNGHEYTPENTYIRPGKAEGRRDCRACIRERVKRYQKRKASTA